MGSKALTEGEYNILLTVNNIAFEGLRIMIEY